MKKKLKRENYMSNFIIMFWLHTLVPACATAHCHMFRLCVSVSLALYNTLWQKSKTIWNIQAYSSISFNLITLCRNFTQMVCVEPENSFYTLPSKCKSHHRIHAKPIMCAFYTHIHTYIYNNIKQPQLNFKTEWEKNRIMNEWVWKKAKFEYTN